MEAANDPALAELLAKQAITEQVYRYCRGLDRFDRAMALACWHEGGTADYGADIFQGSGAGFIDWVFTVHEQGFVTHSHQITNILIALDLAGGTAVSESYVTVALRPRSGDDLVDRGRYLDRWAWSDGRWAITERIFVSDFSGAPGASRGPDDPSWTLGL
jgi:hypothetical protein